MPFPNPDTQFKPGNPGGGRPVGRRSLSTIVRDILEEEIDWKLVPVKNAEELANKYKEKKAWEALVYVAYAKAMSGDTQAMNWLEKSGYGAKVEISGGENPIQVLLKKYGLTGGDNDREDDVAVSSTSKSDS